MEAGGDRLLVPKISFLLFLVWIMKGFDHLMRKCNKTAQLMDWMILIDQV